MSGNGQTFQGSSMRYLAGTQVAVIVGHFLPWRLIKRSLSAQFRRKLAIHSRRSAGLRRLVNTAIVQSKCPEIGRRPSLAYIAISD